MGAEIAPELVARIADPSAEFAEALGQALARLSVELRESEPQRAAWLYEFGGVMLDRAAVLRVLYDQATAQTGCMLGDDDA